MGWLCKNCRNPRQGKRAQGWHCSETGGHEWDFRGGPDLEKAEADCRMGKHYK